MIYLKDFPYSILYHYKNILKKYAKSYKKLLQYAISYIIIYIQVKYIIKKGEAKWTGLKNTEARRIWRSGS